MEDSLGSFCPDRIQSFLAKQHDTHDAVNKKHTAVDGQGMWRSWTRVFAKPESACLDLLDNCFDAALAPNFEGRIVMEALNETSILIQNNSMKRIKSLEAALTVYKSSKNSTVASKKEAIGENGVGLKQGCAALSDCSVVLTRNENTIEIGVIAKQLQSSQGVYLPSFSFDYDSDPNSTNNFIWQLLSENSAILECLMQAFDGENVHHVLAQLVQRLVTSDWENEDHVFLLVLCNLKKNAEKPHELIESVTLAQTFLCDIKTLLPEYYINLPAFNFVIGQERIDFSYWQRRLVELTRFHVYLSPEEPFETLPETNWDQPGPNKYKLSIYCGFDAMRLDRDLTMGQGTSTCYLYIYSCFRLIKKEIDARHMLGLCSSGVDYAQGLTIIVNDVSGKLPLTPTKDGLAWSEQASGDIHRRNLFAWTGAVAQCFWTHHRNSLASKGQKVGNRVKETMKNIIRSFAAEEIPNHVEVATDLEAARLSDFLGVKWYRSKRAHGIDWMIRRNAPHSFLVTKGPDTLFCISKNRTKREKNGSSAKRKADTVLTDGVIATCSPINNSGCHQGVHSSSEEASSWPEVDRMHIPQVTLRTLSALRDLDKERFFERPVVELVPHIKDAYLQIVSKPMDFTTIEKERVHLYTSTAELKEDLVLIFHNCIRFNGAESSFGKIAQNMLDILDGLFQNALAGKRCRKKINYADILNQCKHVTVERKPSSRGNTTSSIVQLRRQLQVERRKVKELEQKLAARDKRIQELQKLQELGVGQLSVLDGNPLGVGQLFVSDGSPQSLQPPVLANDHDNDTGCQICGNSHDHELTILCDGCDDEYHTYCLDPPLYCVPTGNWFCGKCKTGDSNPGPFNSI